MATADTNNTDLARRRHSLEGRRRPPRPGRRRRVQARRPRPALPQVHLRLASSPAATNCKAELTKDGISGKQLDSLLETRDEYTAERVFWVPPESRWPNLQNQATRPDIATLIDDAILAVERDNPNLKGKLPRDYARRGIEPVKMKGLIDLIADIGFKGDRGQGPRHARPRLRVLPRQVRRRRGQARRRVLHAALRRPRARRDARALRGPRLRPLLRLRRHVRAVREVRRSPRRPDAPTSPSSARSPTPPPGASPT